MQGTTHANASQRRRCSLHRKLQVSATTAVEAPPSTVQSQVLAKASNPGCVLDYCQMIAGVVRIITSQSDALPLRDADATGPIVAEGCQRGAG